MAKLFGGSAATELAKLPAVSVTLFGKHPAWGDHIWHLFVIRVAERDKLRARLEAAGIGTMIHYPVPPHLQPACAGLGFPPGSFPITEAIHREVLSLPIGPHLSLESVDTVIEAVAANVSAVSAV